MTTAHYFQYNQPFKLESGGQLPGFQLAYHTFGKINEKRDNVVWIIHALTANSNPLEWWPGVVGPGEAIDPEKHFIVCANCLGSHYGSTSPLSINPGTGRPYYRSVPQFTNRDVVKTFDLLRQFLGIDKINLLTGASLGGQQCLEWTIMQPELIENVHLLATNAEHSPWGIAFNESQRMAIEADPTFHEDRDDGGLLGMKTARSIALLSYRTAVGYNSTQARMNGEIDDYRASSYQRYQGEKLARRFNAYSYWYLSKAMDSHNVGRGRTDTIAALKSIRSNIVVTGIESDILFPIKEQELLARHISGAELVRLKSPLGHDGFLTENEKVSRVFRRII